MKVLVTSPAFLPKVGGLELATAQLAEGLVARGHSVTVVTTTPGPVTETPYAVRRRPSPTELIALTRWCDVFYQANVSLRLAWPLLFVGRPWVVSHHSWYRRSDGRRGLRDRLKLVLLRRAAASIAVSRAIAADLPAGTTVIENAYRDELFRRLPDVVRARELVFVGRLVSEKGVDLLIEAVARLRQRGLQPRLSVVGAGPDRNSLQAKAVELGLTGLVTFFGPREGEDLVRVLNEHEVLVVPSRHQEPFGLVALEGIACGCVVVASRGGGLSDAVGPCGLVFPNGDVEELTNALAVVLLEPTLRDRLRARASQHLAAHSAASVIERYARALETAAR